MFGAAWVRYQCESVTKWAFCGWTSVRSFACQFSRLRVRSFVRRFGSQLSPTINAVRAVFAPSHHVQPMFVSLFCVQCCRRSSSAAHTENFLSRLAALRTATRRRQHSVSPSPIIIIIAPYRRPYGKSLWRKLWSRMARGTSRRVGDLGDFAFVERVVQSEFARSRSWSSHGIGKIGPHGAGHISQNSCWCVFFCVCLVLAVEL